MKLGANETGNIGVIIPEDTYGDAVSFYGTYAVEMERMAGVCVKFLIKK